MAKDGLTLTIYPYTNGYLDDDYLSAEIAWVRDDIHDCLTIEQLIDLLRPDHVEKKTVDRYTKEKRYKLTWFEQE